MGIGERVSCYNPETFEDDDFYEYDTLEEPAEDFGEENVIVIHPGVVMCLEDERDDNEEAVIVAGSSVDLETIKAAVARWRKEN